MSYYVTIKLSPAFHQMTLDEFLDENFYFNPLISNNETNTKTYKTEYISGRFNKRFNHLGIDINSIINSLKKFNEFYNYLREVDRHSLFHTFYIPKKSGGLRKIDAPNDELKMALRNLKTIFEKETKLPLYHTAAFAYIPKRCTIDCVKRHQANESKWFAKFDLSNFFGSTTLDFVLKQFSMIYPFSEVMSRDYGKIELEKALELAFLDGGLPQGTPISPFITNVMMIPIDYHLSKSFRNFEFNWKNSKTFKTNCVYTRYADDFIISSRYTFSYKQAEWLINDTLKKFNAPFSINTKKTRYGSSAGSNWNLGVVLNKDNQITMGFKNKRRFYTMLCSYVMDKINGIEWEKGDVQVMHGLFSYYKMVNKSITEGVVNRCNKKHNVDVIKMITSDLNMRMNQEKNLVPNGISDAEANFGIADGELPF